MGENSVNETNPRCEECGHFQSQHRDEDGGACDYELWDDGEWLLSRCDCARYRASPPLPRGIYVNVSAGTHTEVTLPDGTVHKFSRPITVSGSNANIFITKSFER